MSPGRGTWRTPTCLVSCRLGSEPRWFEKARDVDGPQVRPMGTSCMMERQDLRSSSRDRDGGAKGSACTCARAVRSDERDGGAMAAEFELTDEMRAVIGVESKPWPVEVTTTSIRAFARGVGYTDLRYYDVGEAQAAGH